MFLRRLRLQAFWPPSCSFLWVFLLLLLGALLGSGGEEDDLRIVKEKNRRRSQEDGDAVANSRRKEREIQTKEVCLFADSGSDSHQMF